MKNYIYIIIMVLITAISCKNEMLKEHNYTNINPFNKIEFNSSFDVFLTEDSIFKIKVIADEDVIDNISFKVIDSVLIFNNGTNNKWLSPTKNKIELYINSKQITRIDADQTCKIKTLNPITTEEFGIIFHNKANEATINLSNQKFYYWNDFPCGGKLTLIGNTNDIGIWNTGLTTIDAKNLVAKTAYIENKSKGNCTLTILEKLEYSIFGEGNIILYGSPTEIIKDKVTSSGKLIEY
jgi:hypothetical protein